jgi:hypothetical protein
MVYSGGASPPRVAGANGAQESRWNADKDRRYTRRTSMSIARRRSAATLCTLQLLLFSLPASSADMRNLTGLPAYPNLSSAMMDGVFRTDTLGHWCMRFWSDTSDSIAAVEAWYRKALLGSSEIDLTHDKTYQNIAGVSGVKLVLGIDYVVVYKTAGQSATSIDLYRCSPLN